MDELRAKPIWSAAQRAELAALSEQIHAATVVGETERLRELLPRASQAVNALILAAQAAARRRARAAWTLIQLITVWWHTPNVRAIRRKLPPSTYIFSACSR